MSSAPVTSAANASEAPWFPLRHGKHTSRADGVCLTEAVAWIAGESHTDRPSCLCPVLGAWARTWNDRLPDDETRTRLLGPLAPRLVGSRGAAWIETRRSTLAFDWLIRTYTAAWLEQRPELRKHAEALRGLDEITSNSALPRVQQILDRARDSALVAADRQRHAFRRAVNERPTDGVRFIMDIYLQGMFAATWDSASASGWDAARDAADHPRWAEARAAAWQAAWTAARAYALSACANVIADPGPIEQQYTRAYAATNATFAPVVTSLQSSASSLCLRMIAVGNTTN